MGNVRSTNGKRLWGRRQFLNTAAGSAVGVALVGTPFIASCADANGGAVVRTTDDVEPTSATSEPSGATSPHVGPKSDSVAYRLSTRNQRAPCNACKAHAAHRYFATADVAAASRAHPGCTCLVVANPVTAEQLEAWFDATANNIFDDRWGG